MDAPWRGSPSRFAGREGTLPDLTRAIVDGTGPFSPSQCHRLLESARASVSLEKRLEGLEHEFDESKHAHGNVEQLLTKMHEKVDQLHKQILEERIAREEHHGSVQEKLGEHHATVGERLDYVEKMMGDSIEAHQEQLAAAHAKLADVHAVHREQREQREQLAATHARLDEVQGRATAAKAGSSAWEEHHNTVMERIEYLEKLMGDSIEKHARELAAAHARADSFHGHVAQTIEQVEQHKNDRDQFAETHATMRERVEYLERLLGDSMDKHTQELAAAHAKLDELHSHVSRERSAREEFHENLRDHVTEHRDGLSNDLQASNAALGQKHASLAERVESLERVLQDHDERHDGHSTEVLAMRSAHAAITANEAKVRAVHHATWEERISYVEKLLGDSAEQHAGGLEMAHNKYDKLQAHTSAQQKEMEARFGGVSAQFEKEKDARNALHGLHVSVKERVDYLESMLGDAVDKQARAVAATNERVEQLHTRLAQEQKSRDSHYGIIHEQVAREKEDRDLFGASMSERVAYVERMLGDSTDRYARETEAVHAKVDKLRGRAAAQEDYGSTIESLKQALASQAKERAALAAQQATLAEQLEHLEGRLRGVGERSGQELATMHSKLEQLYGRLAEVGATRDTQFSSVQALVLREQEAREANCATVQERVNYLQDLMSESEDKYSQDLRTQHTALQSRVAVLEQKISDEVAGVRENLAGERQLSARRHENVVEHLGNEKRARDALEAAIHHHLTQERESREAHECAVHEQLGLEQAARDRHHEHIQELFRREQDLRESGLGAFKDSMERERTARDIAQKEVQMSVAMERAAREQNRAAWQETLQDESSQRRVFEDRCMRLIQEKFAHGGGGSSRQLDTAGIRDIQSIQNDLVMIEGAIRKEAETRSVEARQLWRAIDNHTHDLTTQTVELPDERPRRVEDLAPQLSPVASIGTPGVEWRRAEEPPRTYAWEPKAPAPCTPAKTSIVQGTLTSVASYSSQGVQQGKDSGPIRGAVTASTVRSRSPMLGPAHTSMTPPAPMVTSGYTIAAGRGLSEPLVRERTVETVTCGHTRYVGERPFN